MSVAGGLGYWNHKIEVFWVLQDDVNSGWLDMTSFTLDLELVGDCVRDVQMKRSYAYMNSEPENLYIHGPDSFKDLDLTPYFINTK